MQTPRLQLRPITRADQSALVAELNDFEVSRWLARVPYPYQMTDAAEFIGQLQAQPGPVWAVEDDGGICGVISLNKHFGYWLSQRAWGKGYATEAGRAVLSAHFAGEDAPNVGSSYFVGNDASARVLHKLGFREIAPRQMFSRSRNVEVAGREMRLTREMFEAEPLFTLRSERLRLDALTLADVPALHAEWGNPKVARMTATVTANWTFETAKDWLQSRSRQSREGFGLAIRLQDGTLIGSVGMGGNPRNLGYLLAQPYWGNGYATEAVKAYLRAAFRGLPELDDLRASVFDDNPASARVLQKMGFQRMGAGDCTSVSRVDGAASSEYRLTRADWRARNAA